MKPQPVFCECEALVFSDVLIWAPFSWIQRTLRVYVSTPSGTLAKENGSHELVSDYGA